MLCIHTINYNQIKTLMKSINFSFAGLILVLCSIISLQTSAQFSITKRKHLNGFHIDRTSKPAEARNVKPAILIASVVQAQKSSLEQPVTEIHQSASSTFVQFADEAQVKSETVEEITLRSKAVTVKKITAPNKFNFRPIGAGLVKHKHSIDQETPETDHSGAAIASFILALAAILLVIATINSESSFLILGAPVLLIIGLICGIVGLKSKHRPMAIGGIVLNSLGLVVFAAGIVILINFMRSDFGGGNTGSWF